MVLLYFALLLVQKSAQPTELIHKIPNQWLLGYSCEHSRGREVFTVSLRPFPSFCLVVLVTLLFGFWSSRVSRSLDLLLSRKTDRYSRIDRHLVYGFTSVYLNLEQSLPIFHRHRSATGTITLDINDRCQAILPSKCLLMFDIGY